MTACRRSCRFSKTADLSLSGLFRPALLPAATDLKTLHGSLLRDFLPYEALSKKVNAYAENLRGKIF